MLKFRKQPPLSVGVVLLLLSGIQGKVVPSSSSSSYNPHRRETPVDTSHIQSHPQSQSSVQPQIYSTLPEALHPRNPSSSSVPSSLDHTHQQQQANYFNYQVDQVPQTQTQQDSFLSFQPQQFQQQPQPHPQQVQDPFAFQQQQVQAQQQPQFPATFSDGNGNFPVQDFGQGDFSAFDPSANEVQEEESPGFFTSLMNSLLEGTGLGGLVNRAREMWSGLSDTFGGSSTMSRVAMGVMALPLMLPMAAVPIGLGAMGLMALPILQLTLPGIRRSLGDGATLLRSEQCMERLSCNLAKRFEYDALFARLERSENRWLNRVSKSVKAARTGEGCQQFSCSPVSRMQHLVRSYLLGDSPGAGADNKMVIGENEAKSSR